jgi:hypothetical protein
LPGGCTTAAPGLIDFPIARAVPVMAETDDMVIDADRRPSIIRATAKKSLTETER